jgi:8-oxo-dGTP pyrophosphatase MutT (NUDIX family)
VAKNLREFSSGGVVFKTDSGKKLWLVTASTPTEMYPNIVWRLPKGWLDDAEEGIPGPMASGKVKPGEEEIRMTALREVREEAGIEAAILKKIGTEKYFYKHPVRGNIMKFVTFYLMEWVKDLPEGFDEETSEIAWLPAADAKNKLSFKGEKEVLLKAVNLLKEK